MSTRDSSDDSNHSNFEQSFLQGILQDATRWSYGTIGSEVWIFNGVHLVRPDNAIAASSPASHQTSADDLRSSYMSRLADEDHDDYIVPDPLPPGVGFPGILFQEAASGSITQTDINIGALDIDLDKSKIDPETQENPKRRDRKKKRKDFLAWRKVQSIVQNPDNQITERMDAIASAGVGWVTGVPFSIGGNSGIVMFWAREDVDVHRLQTTENERYLKAAAHLVGSAWAVRAPRQHLVEKRTKAKDHNFGRVRRKMQHMLQHSSTLEELAKPKLGSSSFSTSSSSHASTVASRCCHYAQKKLETEIVKFRGANMCVPQPVSANESLFSFVGVLLTLLAVGALNQHLTNTYGKDWTIVMGPLGALLTLQYSLTSAPAAQPRNAVVGQLISLTVAISVGYLPTEVYIKQALGTAIAVGLMGRAAAVHPPGGAAALLFSSGTYSWSNMVTFMLADVITISMAVLINNSNSLRQYPTYWGVGVTKTLLCPPKTKPAVDDETE